MNTEALVAAARDELSLLSRMALSRATLEHKDGVTYVHLDASGWEVMQIGRVREEIESAVKAHCQTEVRFD